MEPKANIGVYALWSHGISSFFYLKFINVRYRRGTSKSNLQLVNNNYIIPKYTITVARTHTTLATTWETVIVSACLGLGRKSSRALYQNSLIFWTTLRRRRALNPDPDSDVTMRDLVCQFLLQRFAVCYVILGNIRMTGNVCLHFFECFFQFSLWFAEENSKHSP